MSSGFSRMIINTRERGVSDDINRAQSLLTQDLSELFRQMLDGVFDDNVLAGIEPTFSPIAGTSTPMSAMIIQGFTVRPQVGNVATLIDPGALFCIDPDSPASEDENPYKFVRDPGVTDTTALQMTPNSSGSTRIDIIECARSETVISSESRDIFNPTTGLFTPSSVPKVEGSRLQYRIRLGTPGGGIPSMVQHWLPLAIASVATGATNWDGAHIYDVRPLVSDLTRQPYQEVSRYAQRTARFRLMPSGGGPSIYVDSEFHASYRQWRAGGTLTTNALGVTGALETGFTPVANRPFYLYLLFPLALPRWVRYTFPGQGILTPQGIRGVPVFSMTAPLSSGQPSASIAIPVDDLGSTNQGVCVATGLCVSGPALPTELMCDGVFTIQNPQPAAVSASASTDTIATFTLTDGVEIPSGCKAVWANFGVFAVKGGSPVQGYIPSLITPVSEGSDSGFLQGTSTWFNPPDFPTNFSAGSGTVRVPLSSTSAPGTARTIKYQYNLGALGCTLDATVPNMVISGFEF